MRTYSQALLLVALAVAVVASLIFGVRTYRSWQLLRSAQELGVADTASIRPWMTVAYIAETYQVPEAALAERLGVPPELGGQVSLRQLASRRGQSPLEAVRDAQEAIAKLRQAPEPARRSSGVTPSTG